MFVVQAIPAVIFLIALFFIPESPRYLVLKGRNEEATGVLTSLFGSDVARSKMEEIKATFNADHRPRLSDVLTPRAAEVSSESDPSCGLESCWLRSSSS